MSEKSGDLAKYLFFEGTNYQTYDYLGVHRAAFVFGCGRRTRSRFSSAAILTAGATPVLWKTRTASGNIRLQPIVSA